MRRHAIVRVAVTSALTLALAAAPLHGASAAPVAGATKKPVTPPADTTAPTDTATPPADTTTPPADGTTPPADGTTPPADGTTPPADATTPPADGTTPPADGTTEPPPEEPKPEEPKPEAETAPAPAPAPDPYADRPEEPRVAGKPRTGKGLMIAGGTVLGVGLAATITFGLMTRHCSYDGPLSCKLKDQDQLLIPLGAAATLAGAMLLAVGIGYHVHYKKWERWKPGDNEKKKRRARSKTAFAPGMLPGGGGLVWVGKF
jgi:hypothetical protein